MRLDRRIQRQQDRRLRRERNVNPIRDIDDVAQAPLNGLGNPINIIYPDDEPVASNLTQKIRSTKQYLYSVLNSVATDRNYSVVGAYDDDTRLNIINYCNELLALLKHKMEGGNFRSLAWKNRLPDVRREFMGAIFGQSRVVPVQHELIVGQMDFIFVSINFCMIFSICLVL